VLLDYGEFVIHVFTEERRMYYGLDGLWSDAPKLDAVALGIDEGNRR
jgi:ribosome-associated protein